MTINTDTTDAAASLHAPRRVRYEPRRRQLQLVSKTYLSPGLLRLVLQGDMSGFDSQGFDDHIKLIFPDPVTGVVTFPGEADSGGPRPIMRDYTPRAFDLAAGQLTLEFALHGLDSNAGPATRWAADAGIGDILHVAGPRGSQLLSDNFRHYLLIGDETAIPAIARRLEELPPGKEVTAVIEVDGPDYHIPLDTRAKATIHWVHRQEQSLDAAVAQLDFTTDDTHVWIASEREEARAIRDQLQQRYGLPLSVFKASAYWHKGNAGKHGGVD